MKGILFQLQNTLQVKWFWGQCQLGTPNTDILEKLLYLYVLMFSYIYHANMGRQFVYIRYNISEITKMHKLHEWS